MSFSVCASDIKPASNCEGAILTPLLSIPVKNLANFAVSEVFAVA